MAAAVTVEEVRRAQRAEGPATVLAIGTATPANCVYQADYPDYYFRITKSEHMVELKEKFKRMCKHPISHLSASSSSTSLIYFDQSGHMHFYIYALCIHAWIYR